MSSERDGRWTLTGPAFEALLRRLGDEPEAAARQYDAVRQKLIGFFRRRSASHPEALADEALDRVARRLDEGEAVEHLSAYFYGVARHVMLEWGRRQAAQRGAENQARLQLRADPADGAEARLACLERCLETLPEESRRLIAGYYRCRLEERKRLAERLGMSYTGLKSQAHRIRVRLGPCLHECVAAGERGDQ